MYTKTGIITIPSPNKIYVYYSRNTNNYHNIEKGQVRTLIYARAGIRGVYIRQVHRWAHAINRHIE